MKTPFYRYLDTDFDGTGTKNATGNYSSAMESFGIQPGSKEIMLVHRMIVLIEDTAVIQAEEYGNLGAALTNGVVVYKTIAGEVDQDLTDGIPIKTNSQWGSLCFDTEVKAWGAGNQVVLVRWTFSRAGEPLYLNGYKSEAIEVRLNDDLQGLINHTFMAQGITQNFV